MLRVSNTKKSANKNNNNCQTVLILCFFVSNILALHYLCQLVIFPACLVSIQACLEYKDQHQNKLRNYQSIGFIEAYFKREREKKRKTDTRKAKQLERVVLHLMGARNQTHTFTTLCQRRLLLTISLKSQPNATRIQLTEKIKLFESRHTLY